MHEQPVDTHQTQVSSMPQFSTARPGKLTLIEEHWKNTAPRVKFLWLSGGIGIVCLGLLIAGTLPSSQQVLQPNAGREAFLLSTQTPTTLAGITADTPPDIALQKLYEVMPQYERWVSEASDGHLDQLITIEAARMAQEAQKAVQKGEGAFPDPAGDIDLAACQQKILPQHCVLLRYAGDGLVRLDAANRAGDVYAAANAYVRFKAALLALQPPPQATPDAQSPLQGLMNYRLAVYDVIRFMPTSQPVTNQFSVPLGENQPGSNLQNKE